MGRRTSGAGTGAAGCTLASAARVAGEPGRRGPRGTEQAGAREQPAFGREFAGERDTDNRRQERHAETDGGSESRAGEGVGRTAGSIIRTHPALLRRTS